MRSLYCNDFPYCAAIVTIILAAVRNRKSRKSDLAYSIQYYCILHTLCPNPPLRKYDYS